ncbi:MAG: hypothetical protein JW795_15790 [Chitinivibrionales bacterium]|nr:hypothetical protein [Chitinivibrionales bacterium]
MNGGDLEVNRLSHERTMFVGVKTTEWLRDQLDSTKSSMKPLFQTNNPDFLQVVHIDGMEYLGKGIENGASLEKLRNVFMNVKTMIRMICPSYSITDEAITIIALDGPTSRNF